MVDTWSMVYPNGLVLGRTVAGSKEFGAGLAPKNGENGPPMFRVDTGRYGKRLGSAAPVHDWGENVLSGI